MFKKGAEKTRRMKEKLAAKKPKKTRKHTHRPIVVVERRVTAAELTAAEKERLGAEQAANEAQDKARGTGGRRTIRMKKGEYLREHHHLFRVLRNPTRRALNAELRKQQKELRERGLK